MTHFLLRIFAIGGLLALLGGCQTTGSTGDSTEAGPNRKALEALEPPGGGFEVTATLASRYRVGDDIRFSVTSAHSGKLWVVQVDAADERSVLFPNPQQRDNTIRAGQPLRIPPAKAKWGFDAAPPLGTNVVAFIVTTGSDRLEDVLPPVVAAGASEPKGFTVRKDLLWGLARHTMVIEARKP